MSKSGALVMIWTVIEPSCGIISACLPFLARISGRYLRGTWATVFKTTCDSGRQSEGADQKDRVFNTRTVIKAFTTDRATQKCKSPAVYEMDDLHVGHGEQGEGQESVRNLIP